MHLNALQLERERDPTYPKAGGKHIPTTTGVGLIAVHVDKPGTVEVKALVKRVPGNMAEVTVGSPPLWKRVGRDGPSEEPLFGEFALKSIG